LRSLRPRSVALSLLSIVSLSLLLLGDRAVAAQTSGEAEILASAPRGEESLDPRERRIWAAVNHRPTSAEVRIVRLTNRQRLERGQSVRLTLAPGQSLTLLPERVESRGPDDFTYFASIQGEPGGAVFVVRSGKLTGSLHVGPELYRIEPIGRGLHALVRVDLSAFPPEDAAFSAASSASVALKKASGERDSKPQPETAGSTLESVTAASAPYSPIRVLVAYTPSVANAHGDILGLIQLAVDETNASFGYSGITPTLELAHAVRVNYTEARAGDLHLTDVRRFRDTADGFMDEVHGLRTTYGADLMALLLNDGSRDGLCGRAYDFGVGAGDAFVTVHYDCATGIYSFGHELGHLAGSRHDTDESSTPFAYGHGYYYAPGGWITIMGVRRTGVVRLQRWSNPSLTYNGIPLGTTNWNNSARVWNERGATMAGFRSGPYCALIPDNIHAWWPLDETSGTTAANLVPNGPGGTHVNGPVPVAGRVIGALSFDGVNDFVRVPNGPGVDFGYGDFSIAGWIKTVQRPAAHVVLLDKRPADFGSYAGYSLHLFSGSLGLQLADGAGWTGTNNFDNSSAFIADGHWHHFAITVDRDHPNGIRFYVDGAQVGSTFNPTAFPGSLSNAADLVIGSRYNQTGLFQGVLDEVQLFGRALTSSEVLAMHAAGNLGTCRPQPLGLSLYCDDLGPEWYCRADPTGGFGPYHYRWTYAGEGTMYSGGAYAEVYQPSSCSPYSLNVIDILVTDLHGATAYDARELPCDGGGPVY
jgi:hypothetical protein